MPRAGPSGVRKQLKHEVVVPQHLGNQVMQSDFPGDMSEPAQQRGTHTAKVLRMRDYHGHLGVSGLLTGNIIGDAKQPARTEGAE